MPASFSTSFTSALASLLRKRAQISPEPTYKSPRKQAGSADGKTFRALQPLQDPVGPLPSKKGEPINKNDNGLSPNARILQHTSSHTSVSNKPPRFSFITLIKGTVSNPPHCLAFTITTNKEHSLQVLLSRPLTRGYSGTSACPRPHPEAHTDNNQTSRKGLNTREKMTTAKRRTHHLG
ncbi:unnamed protein product [Ectocarpus sp. 12 AP-2014]